MKWLLEKLGFKTVTGIETWKSWWSTWLNGVAIALGGTIVIYATFPERMQNLMPDWILIALGGGAMACAFLSSLLGGVVQKKLEAKVEANAALPKRE